MKTKIFKKSLIALAVIPFTVSAKITVMITGQSGVGKSLALNAAANATLNQDITENNLRFMLGINRGKSNHTPPPKSGQKFFFNHQDVQQVVYGQVNSPLPSGTAGSSDTRDFIGYQIKPKIDNWPHGEVLELLDTPGIDDTASKENDNSSVDVQIIRGIESYLREHPDELTAVVIVVSASCNRLGKGTLKTLHAIRDAFPPEFIERLFIWVNRTSERHPVPEELKNILNENVLKGGDHGYTEISADHYTKINPIYLAEFNRYLDEQDEISPEVFQRERQETEQSIQAFFQKIAEFDGPLITKAYNEFVELKKQLASNAYNIIQNQLKIDQEIAEEKHVQARFNDRSSLCHELHAAKHYETKTLWDEFTYTTQKLTRLEDKRETRTVTKEVDVTYVVNGDIDAGDVAQASTFGASAGAAAATVASGPIGWGVGIITGLGNLFLKDKPRIATRKEMRDFDVDVTVPQYDIQEEEKTHQYSYDALKERERTPEEQRKLEEANAIKTSLEESLNAVKHSLKQKHAQNKQYLAAAQHALKSIQKTDYGQELMADAEQLLSQLQHTLKAQFPELYKNISEHAQIESHLQDFCHRLLLESAN